MPKVPTQRLLDIVSDAFKKRHLIPASEKGMINLPKGAGPLAGTAKDLPLAPAHVTSPKIPLTASSPEELKRLEQFVAQPPAIDGKPSKMAQEYAQEAGAAKERALEDYVAKKETGQEYGTKTTQIPVGPDYMSKTVKLPINKSSLIDTATNALSAPQRMLLRNINQKILGLKDEGKDASKSASDMADEVANKLGVSPDTMLGILGRTALATGIEFGADPLNLVGGKVVGQGMKAVKKAPGTLGQGAKLAAESVDALVRKMRAQEAMKVLGKSKAPSTAELLRDSGSKVVKPVGKIVGGK